MLTFQQGTGHSTQHIVGSVFAEVGTEKKKKTLRKIIVRHPVSAKELRASREPYRQAARK